MENKTCAIIQCAPSFLYKKIYFSVPDTLSPNTWSFIITQNMKNTGHILLTKSIEEKYNGQCVRLRGNGPIDYKKLSKRRYGRGPLKTLHELIEIYENK